MLYLAIFDSHGILVHPSDYMIPWIQSQPVVKSQRVWLVYSESIVFVALESLLDFRELHVLHLLLKLLLHLVVELRHGYNIHLGDIDFRRIRVEMLSLLIDVTVEEVLEVGLVLFVVVVEPPIFDLLNLLVTEACELGVVLDFDELSLLVPLGNHPASLKLVHF